MGIINCCNPPVLLAADGARGSKAWHLAALLLLLALLPGLAVAGARFAQVQSITGEVLAVSGAKGKPRILHQGDIVHVGEQISSGSAGEALLLTEDAGMIALRPNAQFLIEAYSAEGQSSDHMALSLVKGGLRVVSGWISGLNREHYIIRTPVVTIGVRGTDHEPYVLLEASPTSAASKPGAYDKVNTGSTVLSNSTGELQVDGGRVGFVPIKPRKRGLLTLLLPRLLELVPDFYVGGQFDQQVDEYSKSAAQASAQALAKARANSTQPASPACAPADEVAKNWITSFDAAVQHRDADAILALFAEDVSVVATVRDASGAAVVNKLSRQELAESAIASVQQLQDYRQQRLSLHAGDLPAEPGANCRRVQVKSSVVEQGRLAGKPYRIESAEEYVLAQREGHWLAVQAAATQR